MCAVGIPHEGIALVIRDGIDDKTLRKHFRRELDTASIKANAKVGGAMFNKAIGGDTAAGKWWTAARMGWKERSVTEHDVTDKFAEILKYVHDHNIGFGPKPME